MNNRELFLRHLAQTSPSPLLLEVVKAEGCWMHTPDGRKILDLISGIGVSTLGHRHPAVVEAVKEQVDKYMHLMVYGELIQSPQILLAQALAESTDGLLDTVYLVNSGSEAIEGALKLAKRATGRFEIITCRNAYHGSSHGALSAMGSEEFKQAYRPLLPGFKRIEFGKIGGLDAVGETTAAVLIETVQGEAGVRTADKSFWRALRERCTETGTLLMLDEIQAGFGRTGTFWSYEQTGIVPDVLITAKAMGGGMPIGAFIARQSLMANLADNPILGHITTFGGHPVSAAASLATLKTLRSMDLEVARHIENRFRDGLAKAPGVIELRSAGCMMALELVSFDKVLALQAYCLSAGVLTDWFLFCNTALRIAPPLIISDEEIDFAIKAINEGLALNA